MYFKENLSSSFSVYQSWSWNLVGVDFTGSFLLYKSYCNPKQNLKWTKWYFFISLKPQPLWFFFMFPHTSHIFNLPKFEKMSSYCKKYFCLCVKVCVLTETESNKVQVSAPLKEQKRHTSNLWGKCVALLDQNKQKQEKWRVYFFQISCWLMFDWCIFSIVSSRLLQRWHRNHTDFQRKKFWCGHFLLLLFWKLQWLF